MVEAKIGELLLCLGKLLALSYLLAGTLLGVLREVVGRLTSLFNKYGSAINPFSL
jgi:hypothetical protein